MVVYRVGNSKFIYDLSGTGSRLFGNRWNKAGIGCVYASESRALAALEYTVNIRLDDIPSALCMATIEIPDSNILSLSRAHLPGNWNDEPAPNETKEFGTKLLLAASHPVIKIPSVIIPDEYNYILNPLHPESESFKIIEAKDFIYDLRIKKA